MRPTGCSAGPAGSARCAAPTARTTATPCAPGSRTCWRGSRPMPPSGDRQPRLGPRVGRRLVPGPEHRAGRAGWRLACTRCRRMPVTNVTAVPRKTRLKSICRVTAAASELAGRVHITEADGGQRADAEVDRVGLGVQVSELAGDGRERHVGVGEEQHRAAQQHDEAAGAGIRRGAQQRADPQHDQHRQHEQADAEQHRPGRLAHPAGHRQDEVDDGGDHHEQQRAEAVPERLAADQSCPPFSHLPILARAGGATQCSPSITMM